MNFAVFAAVALALAPLFLPSAQAQNELGAPSFLSPSKGQPEIRICTQNLFNYGQPPEKKPAGKSKAQQPRDQKRDLIERMQTAQCDLVALQEVTGKKEAQAQRIVDDLAKTLTMVTGKRFYGMLGESRNERIRNGFLISEQAGTVLSSKSFFRRALPPLQPRGPAQSFMRGPIAILLDVRPATGAPPKKLLIVNLHFKSRYSGWKDPTGTEYETTRMEMAEAVREGAKDLVRGHDGHIPQLLLGDLNSNESSATSAILSGVRVLDDFRIPGRCELGRKLEPICPGIEQRTVQFVPLLATEFAGKKAPGSEQKAGSYRYRNKSEFIDEILISRTDLDLIKRPDGSMAVGLTGDFYRGSDHKLLWAELNW